MLPSTLVDLANGQGKRGDVATVKSSMDRASQPKRRELRVVCKNVDPPRARAAPKRFEAFQSGGEA